MYTTAEYAGIRESVYSSSVRDFDDQNFPQLLWHKIPLIGKGSPDPNNKMAMTRCFIVDHHAVRLLELCLLWPHQPNHTSRVKRIHCYGYSSMEAGHAQTSSENWFFYFLVRSRAKMANFYVWRAVLAASVGAVLAGLHIGLSLALLLVLVSAFCCHAFRTAQSMACLRCMGSKAPFPSCLSRITAPRTQSQVLS